MLRGKDISNSLRKATFPAYQSSTVSKFNFALQTHIWNDVGLMSCGPLCHPKTLVHGRHGPGYSPVTVREGDCQRPNWKQRPNCKSCMREATAGQSRAGCRCKTFFAWNKSLLLIQCCNSVVSSPRDSLQRWTNVIGSPWLLVIVKELQWMVDRRTSGTSTFLG